MRLCRDQQTVCKINGNVELQIQSRRCGILSGDAIAAQ